MGFFYFDESIHPRGKFALGTFVYSETSLDAPVSHALFESGLTPRLDEFKSGTRMDRDPKQVRARELLKEIIEKQCGIGVVIAPDCPRELLGAEAPLGLTKILSTIKFQSKSHEVFFDRGIFENEVQGRLQAGKVPSTCPPCNFHFEQDSIQVLGLQVADLVAHTCAMMTLAQLGLLTKTVKAGENSGYNPDLDVPLAFGFWASLRHKFFAAPPPPIDSWKSQLDYQVDVASRGLHIANNCDSILRDAALTRFGTMYLGCIH